MINGSQKALKKPHGLLPFFFKFCSLKIVFLLCQLLGLCSFLHPKSSYGWGKTGHRVVGHIASENLSKSSKKAISALLGHTNLALFSNWADFIKSDPSFRYANPWHYVNFPMESTYQKSKKNKKGDIVQKITFFKEKLKKYHQLDKKQKNAKDSPEKREAILALKFLIHFIADLHQPLHVGLKKDRGGNDLLVKWFQDRTNLHRLWDSDLIDFQKLSYTELASFILLKQAKTNWPKKAHTLVWVQESRSHLKDIYKDFFERLKKRGKKSSRQTKTKDLLTLSYTYNHKWFSLIEQRLYLGGLRLAETLNSIF